MSDNYGQVKRLRAVDTETGEIYGILLASLKRSLGGKFVKIYQRAISDMLLHAKIKLRGESHRVLWFLISELEYSNHIPAVDYTAGKLEMKMPNAYRAYKQLTDNGILIYSKTGYRLSPFLCWRGNEKQYEEFCRELQEASNRYLAIGKSV